MEFVIGLALGLAAGLCIGYVLGRESPGKCMECLMNSREQYGDGMRAGWTDCARTFAGLVARRGVESRNTYTITKGELERIEKELSNNGQS